MTCEYDRGVPCSPARNDLETGLDYFGARYYGSALGRFTSPDPENAGADLEDPQSWNAYGYVKSNPLNSVDPSGACDVSIYGITMNPGENSTVDNFSSGKVAVFPYQGTNLTIGLWQVTTGGGDLHAAVQGIRSAISQTPIGQNVNIFTFSGGAQTLASAWGQLTSSEQNRIGNITYMAPGSLTVSYPRGNGSPVMVFPSANWEIPGGSPSRPFSVSWATSCGHDLACIIRTKRELLKKQSGGPCKNSQVFSAN